MATKAEERKALEQIKKIVEGLGDDSYIGTAFEGCFEIAAQNIENDWACSMKERAEVAERNFSRTHDAYKKVAEELRLAQQTSKVEGEKQEKLRRNLSEVQAALFEAENRAGVAESKLVDMENEIVHLKAKLYDLLIK